MKRGISLMKGFARDSRAVATIEYALIALLVSVVLVGVLLNLGTTIGQTFTTANDSFATAQAAGNGTGGVGGVTTPSPPTKPCKGKKKKNKSC